MERLKWFVGPNIDLISTLYGSSEAFFGIPMDDKQDDNMTYGCLVGMTFLEFIPESEIALQNPRTLRIHQLEVGERYEVVATSPIGLCRYRMGDVVQIVDFYQEAPVFKFCTRIKGTLDLRGEKTSEDIMIAAMKGAVSKWQSDSQLTLTEFTTTEGESLAKACADFKESFLYYAIFVEIDGLEHQPDEEQVEIFDEILKSLSYPYKSFRDKQGIGFPKIVAVRSGSFEELKRFILDRNSAVSNQYKTPKYQTNPELIRFLLDRSIQ